MCGIAGVLTVNERIPSEVLTARINAMTSTMTHRGPDDAGVWTDSVVGLGHRRLAVIDLSSAAHQPMASADNALQIVFNGEIYNFLELRSQLQGLGHTFRSHSDTEVILEGFRRWKHGVFARLRGMFAIAIWDCHSRELILARDRVGKKPLAYGWLGKTLLFASEIKAILSWPGMQRRPNLEAIHHYLTYQYVPSPYSAFEGIQKLPPASYLSVKADGRSELVRYWSLPVPGSATWRPRKELEQELMARLDESVKLRMVSDVPIGAFLSGGVDSSAVVAMMARHSRSPVKTFCIGFEEEAYDERRYARLVSERYETDHHEMLVRPDALSVLPRITWHYGEPFADPSAVPTFYVSQIARRHVTVALNGDGGDESFLGYSRYTQCRKSQWISRVPRPLRAIAGSVARRIPAGWESHKISRVARRVLANIGERDAVRYAPSIAYFYDQDKAMGYGDLLSDQMQRSSLTLLDRWFDQAPDFVAGAAWADIHTYLPDDLLVKVDIASMAFSLEARSPLLDHELMEFAARIPSAQKFAKGETKAILKSALEPFLPRDVLYRPKMGFGVPIDRWLRKELRTFARDILLDSRAVQRGIVKADYVETLLREHCDEVRLHHTRLWALLMLELWFQMWIDPSTPPTTPPLEPALVGITG